MTKIAWRVVLLLAVLSLVATAAVLSGQEPGTTFAWSGPWGGHHNTGSPFNLRIDNHAIYNGIEVPGSTWELKDLVPTADHFFNFEDIKPGDRGEVTISFHVNKDAWICLDFENLEEAENGENEPESLEDVGPAQDAELADGTEFFAWYDDGDDVFEVGEKPIFGTSSPQSATHLLNNDTYALADSLFGPAFPANQTKYIGIAWCAGDLAVNVPAATIDCDGEVLGNAAQTDSFSLDLSFRAVPKKDNPKFTCKKQDTQCHYPGPITITVNNNATVVSTTTSSSNTGGNTGGGSVTTGNASSTSSTTNIINTVRTLLRGGR